MRDLYGHGTHALKDSFYGAFVSTHLNVSDVQEELVHNIRRKRFATTFAQKSIVELEIVMGHPLEQLVGVFDQRMARRSPCSE